MASEGVSVLVLLGVAISFMALVVGVLGLVPKWVPFLEARPHLAEGMRGPLRVLRRFWRVLLALVVMASVELFMWFWPELRLAGLIGICGFLAWWFRREVCSGIRWLYLWLLWQLVIRPARDHRGLIVSPDGEDRVLEGMSDDALRLLSHVTARYVAERPATIDERFLVEPADWLPVRELRSLSEKEAILRQQRACEELLDQGFLTAPKAFEEHERSVLPRLPAWCTLGGGARRVLRAVKLELEERERARSLKAERLERMDALLERERDSTATEDSMWAGEVQELTVAAAWLLNRILYSYRRQPPGDVLMLQAELKELAHELQVPLPKLREACAELVGARFLVNFDWGAHDEGIHLVAVLEQRLKSKKVAGELMRAIRSRLEAEGIWQ